MRLTRIALLVIVATLQSSFPKRRHKSRRHIFIKSHNY